jgi:hypothetical protein
MLEQAGEPVLQYLNKDPYIYFMRTSTLLMTKKESRTAFQCCSNGICLNHLACNVGTGWGACVTVSQQRPIHLFYEDFLAAYEKKGK